MRRASGWLLLLSALAGAGGCRSGSPVVSLAPPGHLPEARQYDKIRERWTRTDRIIKALDTPLTVHATLFSPEFVAAYVSKRTQMFRLTSAEQTALERQLREEAGAAFSFFISATSTEYSWIDFEKPGSVWRIALVNARGEQITPSKVTLERSVTMTVRELFPYIGEFSRTYTLRFPLALPDGRPLLHDDSERMVLTFSGPLGHAELVWRFR